MADHLGDLLVAQGVLDEQQLGRALTLQKNRRISLEQAVVSLGLATEEQVWRLI